MVAAEKARNGDSARLDAAAWTTAALTLLSTTGIDGVRVEVLAKVLNVTKGSFYWHFKDRPALYEAMLAHWRRQATLQLIERLDKGAISPQSRMRQLLRLPIVGRRSAFAADVELAIRLWGRHDPRARTTLQEVDELRLRYISRLLEDSGVSAIDSAARAVIIYSYLRVAATLIPANALALMQRCEDLLIGSRSPD